MRTALAMGAAKGVLVSDPELGRVRRVDHRQGARRGRPEARRGRSDHRRHRVERRLHRHRARADGRGARVCRRSRSPRASRSRAAPSRSTVRPRPATTRSSARLPAVVSVTAGVVEPRYPSFKGIMAAKSKPVETVTAADLGVAPVGWGGADQQIVDVAQAPARAGRRDRRGRRRGASEDRGVPREPQGHLSEAENGETNHGYRQHLGLRCKEADGAPTSTHARTAHQGRARSVAPSRRSSSVTAPAIAATLGEYGAAKVYSTGRPRRQPSRRVPVRRRCKAVIDGGDAPDLIMFPQSYEGRDVDEPPVGQARPHGPDQQHRHRRRRRCRSRSRRRCSVARRW